MSVTGVSVVRYYYAWDTANGDYKTGDDGNHTLKIIADGTQGSVAGSPSEVDATNNPGLYKVTLTAGENTGTGMCLHGTSTGNTILIPVYWDNDAGPVLTAAQVNAEADAALSDYGLPTKTEMDAKIDALNDPTAADVADAVLDEALADHTTAGSLGKAVADIKTDTDNRSIQIDFTEARGT
jgi:hypothetical protein